MINTLQALVQLLRDLNTREVLVFMILFFTGIILFIEWRYPQDTQLFQLFATGLGGFISSLALSMKSAPDHQTPPDEKSGN